MFRPWTFERVDISRLVPENQTRTWESDSYLKIRQNSVFTLSFVSTENRQEWICFLSIYFSIKPQHKMCNGKCTTATTHLHCFTAVVLREKLVTILLASVWPIRGTSSNKKHSHYIDCRVPWCEWMVCVRCDWEMCVGACIPVLEYDPAATEKDGWMDRGRDGRIIESERLYRALKLLNGTKKTNIFYFRAINAIL